MLHENWMFIFDKICSCILSAYQVTRLTIMNNVFIIYFYAHNTMHNILRNAFKCLSFLYIYVCIYIYCVCMYLCASICLCVCLCFVLCPIFNFKTAIMMMLLGTTTSCI